MTYWLSDEHLKYTESYYKYVEELENNPDKILNLVFGLFQIDLDKHIEQEFVILKYAGLQPSCIETMRYWEWQIWLDKMSEYMEKEKEAKEKEEGKTSNTSYKDTKEYRDAQSSMKGMGLDPSRISSSGGMSSPSLPRIGPMGNMGSGFKMPKL